MRHRKEKRTLGRTTAHRDALLRNLVTSLIDKGRITTTLPKAKELRRVADRMITLGKRGDLASRRRAAATIRSEATVKKLFSEVALRSEGRAGGYTRILQLGTRPGDNAQMAIIEFVDRPKPVAEAAPEGKGGAKAKAKAKAPAKAKPAKAPAKKAAAPKAEKAEKAAKPAAKKKAAPAKEAKSGG
jgi:large subunit ribosomal protein L17